MSDKKIVGKIYIVFASAITGGSRRDASVGTVKVVACSRSGGMEGICLLLLLLANAAK